MRKSVDRNTQDCGERIGNALKAIHPYGTAKLVARDTGISQRTVERIIDGTCDPSFGNFVRLLAAYPSLLVALASVIAWAPVAAAAVEMDQLETRHADLKVRAARAAQAMRGRR